VATAHQPIEAPAADDPYGSPERSEWLDFDWHAAQRQVQVDGRMVNLVEVGEGSPILFVHGLSGRWANWLENILPFARDHRVIAMDLPGFGESEMPAGDITISGYGSFLDSLCDELGIDRAALVGNSMGGFIGAELAIRYPHRVHRLVLVSAAGISIENWRNEPALTALRRTEAVGVWMASQLARRSDDFSRRPGLRTLLLGGIIRHPTRLSPNMAFELLQGSGTPGFVPALDALTDYPIRERLPEIACPTLILWGDRDFLVPTRDAHEFERLIPDSRKEIWERTGHLPMVERPARFNRTVAEFLAE